MISTVLPTSLNSVWFHARINVSKTSVCETGAADCVGGTRAFWRWWVCADQKGPPLATIDPLTRRVREAWVW